MNNLHLFELINAPSGLNPLQLGLATALAQWVIYGVPLMMVIVWVRGDHVARLELLQVTLAAVLALALAQLVRYIWPQPRPFVLHVGVQYLVHDDDPGLPSDHVTALWSIALAALGSRRFSLWAFPLLALGLLVGWSRVYLGVHFPFDILAALPVALAGALAAMALRAKLSPAFAWVLSLYDRLVVLLHDKVHRSRKV
jgi:undecaprenyl-diphosphatase